MKEYNVSLLKPNKRFSLPQAERKVRILEFLKNVWRVRHYFQTKFGKEPIILNGDQMPLHRNESSGQKTMSLSGEQTYVKENYMLSRERVTVFTQVSSDDTDPLPPPEFVFKGKGVRVHLNPPDGVKVHWAPKGSYRMETMMATIKNLKNRANIFSHRDFALYILDDYSVHVSEEIRKAFLARGYILVCIGGGITSDVQVNDTHVHHLLKKEYRQKEAQLMLDQLREHPHKVPSPSRNEIMAMLTDSWEGLNINTLQALKSNFILNAFDGSEDFMVRDALFELVGREMLAFREELQQQPVPNNIKELTDMITPPKGVRIKTASENTGPEDEGLELLDCEGEELAAEELCHEIERGGDAENQSDLERADPEHRGADSASPVKSINSLSNAMSLSTVDTSDEAIKLDSKFLDQMKAVLEANETSTLFIPFFCQLKAVYTKARRSLKKRILAERSTVSSGSEKPDQVDEMAQLDNEQHGLQEEDATMDSSAEKLKL